MSDVGNICFLHPSKFSCVSFEMWVTKIFLKTQNAPSTSRGLEAHQAFVSKFFEELPHRKNSSFSKP